MKTRTTVQTRTTRTSTRTTLFRRFQTESRNDDDNIPIRQIKFGETVKLEELGPVIVQSDCTLRRIENWHKLTEGEREATMRRIGGRNRVRLNTLQRTDTDIRCWRTLVILACNNSILETENAAYCIHDKNQRLFLFWTTIGRFEECLALFPTRTP